MAAILRVKRKRNVDPAESIVLSCKKPRSDDESSSTLLTSDCQIKNKFKFAGTTSEKYGVVSKHIRDAIRKEKLEKEYKQHGSNLAAKARKTRQQASLNNRYKILSRNRAAALDNLDEAEGKNCNVQPSTKQDVTALQSGDQANKSSDKTFYLYDIEEEEEESKSSIEKRSPALPSAITCNSVPMVRERGSHHSTGGEDSEFVYDLYYTNDQNFDFRLLEHILCIEAYREEDLVYEHEVDSEDDVYEDDDDSNDEGNWRNDYPNEDPHFYDDSDDCNQSAVSPTMHYGGDQLCDWLSAKCNMVDMGEELSSDEEGVYPDRAPGIRSYHTYHDHVKKELEESDSDYEES